ncbi:MAG: Rne/Rng family ribonuclease [Chloroherpetonaceae bacterium]|nr:Rne/Rng family ribonuclease [Chloroherpetonaceae bacterium]MDW8438656.1 Rne/Rng family ribonuclease [Chloroherpetonaceae bacterium]
MKKQILMSQQGDEIQVAIVEDGRLAELFMDRPDRSRTVGDIYLGRVQKVVEGLQAAFVDIGQEQDGFLHFSDVGTTSEEYRALIGDDFDDEEDEEEDEDDAPETEQAQAAPPKSRAQSNGQGGNGQAASVATAQERRAETLREKRQSYTQMIASKIKPNDSILVQIIKEPIGTKGSRLTSDITIAGRFIVLLPFGQGTIAVSKRIANRRERKRLKNIVRSMLPNRNFGAIVRTVAEEQDEQLLRTDLEMLLNKWKQIEEAVRTSQPPKLIFKEDSLVASTLRDYLTEDVAEIVTNSQSVYKEVLSYVRWAAPDVEKKVQLYKGRLPLYESYGIAKDVESIFSRKVWLKSGGYLIIEQTEAMVVIDVNSGRFAAKKEQEENSLRTNLEAAKEIARQLRLRDIGGIIVVDFIDLLDERNAKKVYETIKQEFKRDRAKSNVLPMSSFGIMQITRERVRPSLMQRMGDQCPACRGTGVIQARKTTLHQIERWLRKFALNAKGAFQKLDLYVSPTLIEPLYKDQQMKPEFKWFLQHLLFVRIKQDESLRSDDFRFVLPKTGADITQEYSF